jgi:peptidoglycan/xylan/chitin deacetylase (PgdA/CDA1 family)
MMRALISNMPYMLVRHLPAIDLLVPYYHLVSDEPVAHVKNLYAHKSVAEFRSDLDFLLRHYTAVGLPELLDAQRRERPLPKRSFLLTFDDGFREMAEIVAPLLLAKGVPAAFFITSAFTDNRALCHQHLASIVAEHIGRGLSPSDIARVRALIAPTGTNGRDPGAAIVALPYRERTAIEAVARAVGVDGLSYLREARPYLTSAQVEWLINKGFAIGAHSIDHPLYAALPLQEQIRQTRESLAFVKGRFGLPYAAFAFPHHDRGVSRRFFSELYGSGELDISFGTGGPAEDVWPRNIQRISFERPRMPARKIVVYATARRIYRTMTGNGRQVRQ